MRKLKLKTVMESPDLVKVGSNQTPPSQFPKEKILAIIDRAKTFEEGRSIDTLRKSVENYTKREYHTKPGNFSNEIRSTGETAYQRAIFQSGKTTLNTLSEVSWRDLELPVLFSKNSRRRCVDLIGTSDENVPVLCELKFASQIGNSGSPIYAAIELLIYYYLIQDNYQELDAKKVFRGNLRSFRWEDFNLSSIFIVGANEKYWRFWQKRYEKRKNEVESWLNSLPLIIRFFSSANINFKEQKGTQKQYTPSLSGKTDWTEVSLNNSQLPEDNQDI